MFIVELALMCVEYVVIGVDAVMSSLNAFISMIGDGLTGLGLETSAESPDTETPGNNDNNNNQSDVQPWTGGGLLSAELQMILTYILVACMVVSPIFAIYLGFKIAKAEDDGTRQKAKKRFVNALVAIFCIVILWIILGQAESWGAALAS